ncbi:MAG TPA: hypothetical protein VKI61_17485 [Chitinophagaceae bacterium]|jgi:hypothetical protein|nr:hypothetical protein [Chitinophagaceae bacterium]
MKKLFAGVFVLSCFIGQAQEHPNTAATEQLTVEGKVEKPFVFTLKDAGEYKIYSVDSLVIYNHLHERKRTVRNIKGILLKDILSKVVIDEKSPKLLSEFYFTCLAADGYKVVFSWNEIFNTEIGNHIMIATEADGLKGEMMPDRLQLLSVADIATGRRFMKGISKIIVDRAK